MNFTTHHLQFHAEAQMPLELDDQAGSSLRGALVGGLFIGLVEALAGSYLGGEYKLLATFIVLVCILMVRPYGLFGTHEIERL